MGTNAQNTAKARSELARYDHYIGGRQEPPAGGSYFETENPYTSEPWAMIARGDGRDVERAVAAAKAAFPQWAGMKPSRRGRLLNLLADEIEKDAARLAEIEVRDNGKLYAEMSAQTRYIAEWFRYFGGLADKIQGAVIPTDKTDIFNFTQYEPLGVVGMITPWNSPLLLLTWKLAPALAAGNVAVIKPSEFTSASTLEFMALFERAGFPPGVVNVVTGFGADVGAALVEHPDVAKIAFTGSDVSGQKVYESAARTIKVVSLELGGKSPNVVFADANLENAARGVAAGIFASCGQSCVAGSRLVVEQSVKEPLLARVIDLAKGIKMGDPRDPKTEMGPIANRQQFDRILARITSAEAEGARLLLGGKPAERPECGAGLFIEPTIFDDVTSDMTIAREEVFGPVLSVLTFDDEQEAVEIANDSPYGLGAGIWTQNLSRAHRVAARIQAGSIWINTYRISSQLSPFGGFKRSGIGREGGIETIKTYLQTKSVWIDLNPEFPYPFAVR